MRKRRSRILPSLVLCAFVGSGCNGGSPTAPTKPGTPTVIASLSSVTVTPSPVESGTSGQGTVTLTAAAPAGDTSVTLSSSSAAATVPASVTVNAGATSATFAIATTAVTADTDVTITATASGASRTATLRINAPPEPPRPLAGLSSRLMEMAGGTNTFGAITLTAPAPPGGVLVNLTSEDPSVARVPASVTVPAGATSAEFRIDTAPVQTARDVRITASFVATPSLQTAAASLTLTVRLLPLSAIPAPPVASADAYAATEDTTLTVVVSAGVLANDSDINGDALSVVLVSSTTNGRLALQPDGSFAYTPRDNFNGSDSFRYRASDGDSASDVVVVTLTVAAVNDAPAGVSEIYTTAENALLTVAASSGVLANDTDPDRDTLTAVLVSSTANGALELRPDGSFTYTPARRFSGRDTFRYRASDGTLSSDAVEVTIDIAAAASAPPVTEADVYIAAEDTTLSIPASVGVLANDSDVNGDLLAAQVVSATTNGTLALSDDGAFTYTPSANFNGTDSFTYRVSDGTATSAPATVTITVDAINDAPAFTAGGNQTVDEDSGTRTVVGWATGISAGPGDSGQTITFSVTNNTNAALFSGAPSVTAAGVLSFTPAADAFGTATITLRAQDDGGTANGGVNTSATRQFTITVNQLFDDDQTFALTGASQTFTVPAGVTSIMVDVSGAAGGSSAAGTPLGGLGGRITATSPVSPGEVLQVNVGGAGAPGVEGGIVAGGFNGGGSVSGCVGANSGGAGGGGSDIRRDSDNSGSYALEERVVVGGGGGGADSAAFAVGGAGGGTTGGSGGGGGAGRGGTQAAGGAGGAGVPAGASGSSGGLGSGGSSARCTGAGGGGLYGGGSGGDGAGIVGGGGGGSSFAIGTATGVTHQQGVRSGNGVVIIRW